MKHITIEELCAKRNTEGLVLQGCGGDLQEWVDGINDMLTQEKILLNGAKFEDISCFEYEGLTNLLFTMDHVDLNAGKLAAWRLGTHAQFSGKWLSDYLANNFDIDINSNPKPQKPDCALIGQDGNVFNLIGIASRTLKENQQAEQAQEMRNRITACGSYDEALCIIGEYVNITAVDDMDMGGQTQSY